MSKFLVGSYTDERGGLGVSILRLDRESGSLSIEEGVISPDVCGESPSFATIFRDNGTYFLSFKPYSNNNP